MKRKTSKEMLAQYSKGYAAGRKKGRTEPDFSRFTTEQLKKLSSEIEAVIDEREHAPFARFAELGLGEKLRIGEGMRGIVISSEGIEEQYQHDGKAVLLTNHSDGDIWNVLAKGIFQTYVKDGDFEVVE